MVVELPFRPSARESLLPLRKIPVPAPEPEDTTLEVSAVCDSEGARFRLGLGRIKRLATPEPIELLDRMEAERSGLMMKLELVVDVA
jgi:hypothetical protein